MQVMKERFEDAGEQDEQGLYDYYYAGYIYNFVFSREVLIVRRYEDTPDKASFMGRKVKGRRKWKAQCFETVPYDSAEFQQAIEYLRENEGISRVTVWLREYVPVDLSRIAVLTAFSILQLDSVPSTNDLVLDHLRAGSATAGQVYVARKQPGARGRMGRRWDAEEGGLWFTAALPLYGEHVGWAGMLAALAVCQALDELGLRAGVKWPNDVVIGQKKLAGVLVEGVAGRELAAVGVGLNVSNPLPDEPADGGRMAAARPETAAPLWPPTSVAVETGQEWDPQALLSPILARLGELWRLWEAGRLEELREAWSARDVCRGHPVRLLPDGPQGVADGIDITGALQVRLPGGRVQLARAGELSFVDHGGSTGSAEARRE